MSGRKPATDADGRQPDVPRMLRHDTSLRVLGIAMIVDQRGIGARLIARYPMEPVPPQENSPSTMVNNNASKDDTFFKLTSHQMAKLFRTKKTLCGQPMTLNVNGTVFCCRSILMEGDEGTSEDHAASKNSSGNASQSPSESKNEIVLFSVVVALSSPSHHGVISSSASAHPSHEHDFSNEAVENVMDLQRFMISMSTPNSNEDYQKHQSFRHASTSFMCIRRVHLSLARFCRVLEREERRCQYITQQANQFFRIRGDCNKKWEERRAALANASISKQAGASGGSSNSVGTNKSNQAPSVNRQMRQGSFMTSFNEDRDQTESNNSTKQSLEEMMRLEQAKEQEVMELMLAASPPAIDEEEEFSAIPLHGNLVQELVQVFHSLSRNDYEYPPTPSAILSERDSVVYVNHHVAVPIEAASMNMTLNSNTSANVRPYHTLLFPHASPSELLHAFQLSGSSVPQRLQQLLLTVDPQKSLSEIALDANLSLYTTMETASYLIAHGACVTSPVVNRNSRLACRIVHRIPQLSLEFSQKFPNVDLFRLVGFLTSSLTIGGAMAFLTNVESVQGEWLRESLQPFTSSMTEVLDNHLDLADSIGNGQPQDRHSPIMGGSPQPQPQKLWEEEMEELLYAMAMWLLSHRVLSQIQDYVAVASVTTDSNSDSDLRKSSGSNRKFTDQSDEKLLKELVEAEYLDGNISIPALCWRMALEPSKVRAWGFRHPRVRIVSRLPSPGDDWEPTL